MASLTPRLDRLERNLAINGNFDFWQRGTSITNRAAGDSNLLADRFRLTLAGTSAIYRMDRSTDVPTYAQSGFQSAYSLAIQPTTADASVAAGDIVILRHFIEGYDYQQIASGKKFRIQFWAKSTLAGTYCLNLMNDANNRNYIKEYSLTANTWTKVVADFTSDTAGTWLLDNSAGLQVCWTLMSGTTFQGNANTWQAGNLRGTSNQANFSSSTSNVFYITQVMLIPGDFADTDVDIPFTRAGKTISDELTMCQRYCERLERKTGQQNLIGMAYLINGSVFIAQCPFKVSKRTNTISILQSAISNQFVLTYNGTSQAFNTLTLFGETDEFSARVGNSGMAGLTPVSGAGSVAFNADSAYIVFDAEF
jgi:hypothetical protein